MRRITKGSEKIKPGRRLGVERIARSSTTLDVLGTRGAALLFAGSRMTLAPVLSFDGGRIIVTHPGNPRGDLEAEYRNREMASGVARPFSANARRLGRPEMPPRDDGKAVRPPTGKGPAKRGRASAGVT
jgi:hypothetical protein